MGRSHFPAELRVVLEVGRSFPVCLAHKESPPPHLDDAGPSLPQPSTPRQGTLALSHNTMTVPNRVQTLFPFNAHDSPVRPVEKHAHFILRNLKSKIRNCSGSRWLAWSYLRRVRRSTETAWVYHQNSEMTRTVLWWLALCVTCLSHGCVSVCARSVIPNSLRPHGV